MTMSYSGEVLGAGAAKSAQAADGAAGVQSALGGANTSGGMFGNVGPAGSLASALEAARQAHIRGAATAQNNQAEASVRATTTARLGAELVTDTTVIARNGNSSAITDRM